MVKMMIGIVLYLTSSIGFSTSLNDSVVKIYDADFLGHGTGFLLKHKDKKRIITANHVCSSAKTSNGGVYFVYKQKVYKSKIDKELEKYDICSIMVPSTLKGAFLSLSNKLPSYGDIIHSLGWPGILPLTERHGRYVKPFLVSFLAKGLGAGSCDKAGFDWDRDNEICIQRIPAHRSNLLAAPGMSGAPVFNISNKVVGVLIAIKPRANPPVTAHVGITAILKVLND